LNNSTYSQTLVQIFHYKTAAEVLICSFYTAYVYSGPNLEGTTLTDSKTSKWLLHTTLLHLSKGLFPGQPG